MLSLPKESWERLIIWMAIGILIYFLYSRKHSVIRRNVLKEKKDAEAE
jgi:APA family basic amino acid/polyamine antiporter